MTELTLEAAQKIAATALKTAREKSFKPLAVVVYDDRGALKALLAEDGTSIKRAEIAMGKAAAGIEAVGLVFDTGA
ncbi:MAG: GlcG protein [Microvirga sp.]|nr:GlcG protein [Microvirga sp.]